MTRHVLEVRDEISQIRHARSAVSDKAPHGTFMDCDSYFGFCAAKDWLQDTGEAILCHRDRGLSADSRSAYLEFWGVMQATFVQQDAINALRAALGCERHQPDNESAWRRLRDLRNLALGHPTKQGCAGQPRPGVTGRSTKTNEAIDSHVYQNCCAFGCQLRLGELLDAVDLEASHALPPAKEALMRQLGQFAGSDSFPP